MTATKLTGAQRAIVDRLRAGERLYSSPDMNAASGWHWAFGNESNKRLPEKACRALMSAGLIRIGGRSGPSLTWILAQD